MIQIYQIPNDKTILFEILLGNVDVVILNKESGDFWTSYELDSDEMDKIDLIFNELINE